MFSPFVERLKSLRERKNRTQKDVSEYLNMSSSSYSKYEYGLREPNLETVVKIADYFDVSLDYLLGRIDEDDMLYKPVTNEVVMDHAKQLEELRDRIDKLWNQENKP